MLWNIACKWIRVRPEPTCHFNAIRLLMRDTLFSGDSPHIIMWSVRKRSLQEGENKDSQCWNESLTYAALKCFWEIPTYEFGSHNYMTSPNFFFFFFSKWNGMTGQFYYRQEEKKKSTLGATKCKVNIHSNVLWSIAIWKKVQSFLLVIMRLRCCSCALNSINCDHSDMTNRCSTSSEASLNAMDANHS